MRRKIFVMAWCIARDGAKKFGGKAKEYLSQALKEAYRLYKSVKKYKANHLFRVYQDDEYIQLLERSVISFMKGLSETFYYCGGKEISKKTYKKYESALNWSHLNYSGTLLISSLAPRAFRNLIIDEYKKMAKEIGIEIKEVIYA